MNGLDVVLIYGSLYPLFLIAHIDLFPQLMNFILYIRISLALFGGFQLSHDFLV